MKIFLFPVAGFLSIVLISCNNQPSGQSTDHAMAHRDTLYCAPGSSNLDAQKIEQLTGMKGTAKNGEYKITVPQNDLNVVVDGFKIIPAMGLGTWIAFTSCADSMQSIRPA